MQWSWSPPVELVRRAVPLAVILVLAAVAYWWSAAPSSTAAADMPTGQSHAVAIVVDVEGAVRHPGVLRMRPGARVFDAVDAAGGMTPGAEAGVNLARPLIDGELIVLGATGATGAVADGRVNVNRATAAELEALPGIGAVLAQRIVDQRAKRGPFRRTRDLLQVAGIGEAKFRDLADRVTVG